MAKLEDTHKKAEGSILSDKIPAKLGINTPPTISPIPETKPIAFPFRCSGTVAEGITAATMGIDPIVK